MIGQKFFCSQDQVQIWTLGVVNLKFVDVTKKTGLFAPLRFVDTFF
jgi:hypothetical protein